VVEDGPELRWAVAQTGVAIDALRHLDAQRRQLPLGVALPRRDAFLAGPCWHLARLGQWLRAADTGPGEPADAADRRGRRRCNRVGCTTHRSEEARPARLGPAEPPQPG